MIGKGLGKIRNRKFRISDLFLKISRTTKNCEKFLVDWNKRFPHINTTNLSREDSITITAEEAEETARIFATNNVKRKSNITDNLFHLFLNERDDNFMELVFPEPHVSHTLSFLSAFIIKVAYEAYTKIYPKDAELTLDYISLNAQHIALQMLEGTHRVTSLVAWNNDKYKEWLVMLEMGIPHVFDPKGGTNQMIEYQPFIHEDGSKSVPYSSAAGVIVMKKYQHDIAQPYIVASASGSERTVEGVVNSVLNLLLFNHTYHGALAASLHFKEKFGFHCVENINETNVLDRSMMLGWRPRRSKSLHMALSGPEELYNYATGY
ncbi:hypothetical protein DICVIV_09519 [Dictyocaulus viviparus]|uniref:Uncharacterized protein n=1 Tax=Dictyocaulus viviparus TaxID=29172 RepID=A0A0D8XII0_DICVI|nr:hypothetical protein DICVIV_09519 [Dictyocaulus viviparus]